MIFPSVIVLLAVQVLSVQGLTSLGCWRDNPGRVLENKAGNVRSVQQCVRKCQQGGYRYAAVEYGKQCFCGSSSYKVYGKSNNCDMKCESGGKYCGGSWAMNVYRTGNRPTLPGLKSLGCWKDKPKRALKKRVGNVRSVKQCVKKCKRKGYLYAAVEHGKQCFCGSTSYKVHGRSNKCNMKCKIGGKYCGGFWAMNVYRTGNRPTLPGLKSLGCWKDKPKRALEKGVGNVKNVRQCVRKCKRGGYPYAAVEYGKQCFCGSSTYKVYGRSNKCNMKCKIGGKYCGGFWAMNVYRTGNRPTLPGLKSLGCWKDNEERALEKRVGNVRNVKQCVRKCKQGRYLYAAVEYGKQCFCGSSSYKVYGRSNKCNMKCKIGGKYCGGFWAMNVYRTGNRPTLPGLKLLGCWKDNEERALEKRVGNVRNVQQCVRKCKQRGHLYAAVEYGKQCFCGSTSYKVYGRSNKCNMKCKIGGKYCGGFWAMNVYRTGNRPTLPRLKSLGCWKDDEERALEKRVGNVKNVRQCVKKCKQRGYLYAAVEYGKQCFCGSSSYKVYGRSNKCNMKCKIGGKYCGGFWAMNVYRTGNRPKLPRLKSLGCWGDNEERALEKRVGNVRNVLQCVRRCKRGDYRYAAVEFGKQCFCGSTSYKIYGRSNKCTMKCKTGRKYCGGEWAMNVYRTE